MTPTLRKLSLTAHVTTSLGWQGAVAAYLAIVIGGAASHDDGIVRGIWLAMWTILMYVIVPCSLAALLTGGIHALATEWGMFRHYWIVAKFALTIVAITLLLMHLPTVSSLSGAAEPEIGQARAELILHAAGGLVVLLTIAAISIFKPWGLTPYGRMAAAASLPKSYAWPAYALLVMAGSVVLLIILHSHGGPHSH